MLFACNDNGTTNQTTESEKNTTTTRRTAVTTENIEPLIPPKDGIVRTYFFIIAPAKAEKFIRKRIKE